MHGELFYMFKSLSAKLSLSDRGLEGPESEGQEEEIQSNAAYTVQ